MPLAIEVDSLESIPEHFRTEYTEQDGKFRLNVTGLEGLTSALAKERALNKAVRQSGRTPEEIAATLDAAAEVAEKATNLDSIISQHQARHASELAKVLAERDTAIASERSAIVDATLVTALRTARVTDEGQDLLASRLMDQIQLVTDAGRRTLQITQRDGTPMLRSDGSPASVADLVAAARQGFPSLFEGLGGGSGTRQSSQQRPAGGKILTLTEFHALGAHERMEKMKAGWTLVD